MTSGRVLVRLTALALVVAIVCLTAQVLPVIRAEAHLRGAAGTISHDPVRGFQTLEADAGVEGLSRRQKERGSVLARKALETVRGGRPLLKLVGRRSFDTAAPARPYFTASHEMMLTFELPPGLKDLGVRIRVSDGAQNLCDVRLTEDGTRGRGEVPLKIGGTVIADVDLVCPVGVYGTLTEPIARGLQLVQKSRGPSLVLKAGQRVDELHDGESLRLQVDRGTALRVELSDELGLGDFQWSVDGVAHDPSDWSEDAEADTRGADLPVDLTSVAAHARLLEFKASNSIALTTRAVVELLVREPGDPPIAQARIEHGEIKDGSTIHAAERALTLTVLMAKGELAEDLSVVWDEHPAKTHVSGSEASALLSAGTEGARSLVLKVGNAPVLRATIVFDWTPPAVSAILDPGHLARELEMRRAIHDVPLGSIVSFTMSDGVGIDRDLTEWEFESLEELVEPEPTSRGAEAARIWTRRFRCAQAGEARVRLFGSDTSGNRTPIYEYRIRTADPMQDRTVTLNGRPFAAGATMYFRETHFLVKTEGGIELDGLRFLVLDPEQQNAPLGQTGLERGDLANTKTGSIDLSFIAASRRVIGVLSLNGRELVKGDIVIDFASPSFRVVGLEEAGTQNGIPRFFGSAGQRVSLTLTDDVGVDVSTVSVLRGANIEKVLGGGSEVGVVLLLPAVIEEPVVVSAMDLAKNQAEFRFDVISREAPVPATRVTPQSRPAIDPGPAPPDHAPSLAELSGTPKITHPLLGVFLLVPVKDQNGVPPFYIGERELTVKDWRAFVKELQGTTGARREELVREAGRLLSRNTNVLSKGEEDPLAGTTGELVKAYVTWANEIARDHGVWKVPTAAQWRLAAGRATHSEAVYPTTANFQNGSDLNDEGNGGALFGRDFLAVQEMPKRALSPGAFGLRAMAGSLFEWVVDPQGHLRLIGGSAISPKDACRLDAPLRSGIEVADYERGLRLALLPRGR